MTFYNKISWFIGTWVVFALILTTNLVDKKNFSQIQHSINTIYNDRLIASDFLFKIQQLMYQKKLDYVPGDSSINQDRQSAINEQIGLLLDEYEDTQFTDKESIIFRNIKKHFGKIQQLDQQSNFLEPDEISSRISMIDNVKKEIIDLQKIQIEEGKEQLINSDRLLKKVDLFTKIEIYMMIFIGIIIQLVIIFYPRKYKV